MSTVLDSSALLALFWQETGHEAVSAVIGDSQISAVNMAEVYTKFSDRGVNIETARLLIEEINIKTVAFDDRQAILAGQLRAETRACGLSLGDRACLALGAVQDAPILTADKVWLQLDLGLDIRAIR
jgi:ribonuclease VapC